MTDPHLKTHFDSLLTAQSGPGWFNPITGMNTARDKTAYTQFNTSFQPLDPDTLAALYHGSDLAARVVDVIPEEELRLEFDVLIPSNEKAEKLVASEFKRLDVRQNLLEGRVWGRCFGGSATILGIQDGRPAYMPLDWSRVRGPALWLRTVDRRCLWPEKWYGYGSKNGQVEVYWLNETSPANSDSFRIHESRLLIWPGARTAANEKNNNNSWDHSVLDKCWPALKAFETVYKGVELLITEGPQAVYKVKGLFDKLVAGEENALRTRFELIDMYRSMMRAIIIDADGSESFERQQVTYSGTPEILNQMQMRLSAATQIPMMVLFGQAPGGLGVTGENDLRWFFDRTASSQRNVLAPKIERLARIVLKSNGVAVEDLEIDVKFRELWTPSAKEQAEARMYQAQTDEKYIQNNVLLPEEVLLSRFKDKGQWSTEWSAVDREARIEMLEEALEQLKEGGSVQPPQQSQTGAPNEQQPTGTDDQGTGTEDGGAGGVRSGDVEETGSSSVPKRKPGESAAGR